MKAISIIKLTLIGVTLAAVISLGWFAFSVRVSAVDPITGVGSQESLAAPVARPVYAVSPEGQIMKNTNGSEWERVEEAPKGRATVLLQGQGSVIYAGTESSGLYRSDDGGATWALLTDKMGVPMPNLTVTALAGDPAGKAIYVAAGYWMGTSKVHYAPLGVYVSGDRGLTWQQMNGSTPAGAIVALAVDESDPTVVVAKVEGSEVQIQYKQ